MVLNGLKMVLNGLKMVYKNDVRIVWFCWFWDSMNGWDLKILYTDLESWKKWLKKKWNGMKWVAQTWVQYYAKLLSKCCSNPIGL